MGDGGLKVSAGNERTEQAGSPYAGHTARESQDPARGQTETRSPGTRTTVVRAGAMVKVQDQDAVCNGRRGKDWKALESRAAGGDRPNRAGTSVYR